MKPLHWILLLVVLAGGGFAVYWFGFRKKPSEVMLPQGSPYYTPPSYQPAQTYGKTPSAPSGQRGMLQGLTATLQQKASTVASAAIGKGVSALGDKAFEALGGLFDDEE